MRTIDISVCQGNQSPIVIGRRGETEATQIRFDVSGLIGLYGDGVAVLMAMRPTDTVAYPVSTERDGSTVIWAVTDADTAYKGRGECELFWYVGETIAKTFVYSTVIDRDIGETTVDPPDAYETWVDTLTELGAETLENARDAAQSAADAETAQEAAETAQGKAEAAKEAAETAQQKAEDAQSAAERSESAAGDYASDSEAWAIGKRGGADVPQTDETYNNNAKHYAYLAEQGADRSGYVWFDVDQSDGEMYVTITDTLAGDVSFEVNTTTGELEVIVV